MEEKMRYIRVDENNIDTEHICCAIADNKDCQVRSKKEWMKKRFQEGLVFLKADVRGKCFIEYVPAENAWAPVNARDYMYIDCLWVSGKYKGQGYSKELLEQCIRDAKEQKKVGLVVLSSKKKMGFLSDPKYLKKMGFLLADSAEPYFELYYLPFGEVSHVPCFMEQVKQPVEPSEGFVLYYSSQCPFTAKYVPILQNMAQEKSIPFDAVHIETTEQARTLPTPDSMFTLYYKGKFLTHEILSEKKFEKIIDINCQFAYNKRV